MRCASPARPTHLPRGQHPAAGCCPPPRWAETNYPSVINQLPARASPFQFMTEATSMVVTTMPRPGSCTVNATNPSTGECNTSICPSGCAPCDETDECHRYFFYLFLMKTFLSLENITRQSAACSALLSDWSPMSQTSNFVSPCVQVAKYSFVNATKMQGAFPDAT